MSPDDPGPVARPMWRSCCAGSEMAAEGWFEMAFPVDG
jgi:hypothetical protein